MQCEKPMAKEQVRLAGQAQSRPWAWLCKRFAGNVLSTITGGRHTGCTPHCKPQPRSVSGRSRSDTGFQILGDETA